MTEHLIELVTPADFAKNGVTPIVVEHGDIKVPFIVCVDEKLGWRVIFDVALHLQEEMLINHFTDAGILTTDHYACGVCGKITIHKAPALLSALIGVPLRCCDCPLALRSQP